MLDKTSDGGITTVKNYGSNQILERQSLLLMPSYQYDTQVFTFRAEARCEIERSLSSLVYPYLKWQQTQLLDTRVSARYHLGALELELWLGASLGSLRERESQLSEVQVEGLPQRYEQGFAQIYEYLCMPKAKGGLQARWYPGGKSWFLGLDAEALLGLGPCEVLDGRTRAGASLTVGLDF